MKKFIVEFRYKDQYTRGKGSSCSGEFEAKDRSEARRKAIEFFGLDGCDEYEILSITEVEY